MRDRSSVLLTALVDPFLMPCVYTTRSPLSLSSSLSLSDVKWLMLIDLNPPQKILILFWTLRFCNPLIIKEGCYIKYVNLQNTKSGMKINYERNITEYECRPVSYTHLDVYKRQVVTWKKMSVSKDTRHKKRCSEGRDIPAGRVLHDLDTQTLNGFVGYLQRWHS